MFYEDSRIWSTLGMKGRWYARHFFSLFQTFLTNSCCDEQVVRLLSRRFMTGEWIWSRKRHEIFSKNGEFSVAGPPTSEYNSGLSKLESGERENTSPWFLKNGYARSRSIWGISFDDTDNYNELNKLNDIESYKLQWRVWSWLRTNAGGVLNTCKSKENEFFGILLHWRTGE